MFFSCGSGLSGEVLTDEGHYWVGLDISQAMLGSKYIYYYINWSVSWKFLPLIKTVSPHVKNYYNFTCV